MHAVSMQCKVSDVGNYLNPSLCPFAEVCCSIEGFSFLCIRDMTYLNDYPFSPIFTYLYPFHPLAILVELRRIDATVSSLHQDCQQKIERRREVDLRVSLSPKSYTNHASAFTLHHVL